MIDGKNFCHIEVLEDGNKVLFWMEFDGDDVVLHQVASPSVGTFDLKMTMPSEKWEELWPDKVRFSDAAKMVASEIKKLGFGFEEDDSSDAD